MLSQVVYWGNRWACMFFPGLPGQEVTHPVHNEDLAHIQPLLEKFGCNCYGVKIAEAPAKMMSSYCFYTTHSRILRVYEILEGPGEDHLVPNWYL